MFCCPPDKGVVISYTRGMQILLSGSVALWWGRGTDVALGILLLVTWILSLKNNAHFAAYRRVALLCLTLVIMSAFGYQGYALWYYNQSPIGRNLLPPHSLYFYQQLGVALSNMISGIIAAACILVFGLVSTRSGRLSQFGADDWMALTLGTLAVGWPAVLPFLAIVVLLSILGLITQIVLRKKTLADRLILTPYILPGAIITLIIKSPVLTFTHLDKIRF